jgi:DNA mismatch repair protein MutS2
VQKIQQDIKKTLKKLKNGELSPIDADKYLRNISSTAQQQASKAIEAMIEEDAPRSDSWIPKRGETVRIVNMGGALATVESVNSNKQNVSVLLGMMKMDINIADISPTRGQKGQQAPKKDKLSLESAQSKDTIEQSEYSYGMPAIQTSQNTVDLRGETADDAISSLQQAIGTARPASILFVVHGVGSGRVRAAVLGYLRNNSNGIRKIEQDPGSNGGCTIVYLQ